MARRAVKPQLAVLLGLLPQLLTLRSAELLGSGLRMFTFRHDAQTQFSLRSTQLSIVVNEPDTADHT
jgi:hypothetical protein